MKQNWWSKLTPEQKLDFYAKRRKRYAESPETREKGRARCRKWNSANQRNHKKRTLKFRYGITIVQYEGMVSAQEDKCAICGDGREQRKYRVDLVLDHDHVTGKLRGLLCDHCNKAIGFLKDDTGRLRAAAEYLELHRT